MKLIYMNEMLYMMQDAAEDKVEFQNWVNTSGEIKQFDSKPYLVTIVNDK